MSKVRQQFKTGDRVFDRYRLPKLGVDWVIGTVASVEQTRDGSEIVTVDWDESGPFQPTRYCVPAGFLELVTERKEGGQA